MIVGTIIGTIAIVLATVALGLLVDRKAKLMVPAEELRGKPAPRITPGETAATAIRAGDSQVQRLRASQRCGECRAEMTVQPDDHAQLGGKELVLLRFRCSQCAARRTIYIHALA
jgi:hypothetical protein